MESTAMQHEMDIAGWSKLVELGSTNAISGLSEMVEQEMTIVALSVEEVSLRNAARLVGKADDLMVGIYLEFSGNTTGHLVLAFQPAMAFELADMAMNLPSGSTQDLGEMERSVLGEIGNIVGSFFLNAIADYAGLRLQPSPPAVVMDMGGAIIDAVVAEALQDRDSVYVTRLLFSTPNREIEGLFLVLPAFDLSDVAPKSSGVS